MVLSAASTRNYRKFRPDGQHVVAANVLHEGKYWIARVPTQRIVEVDIGFEKFLTIVAHVFLQFRFSDDAPIELRGQTGPQTATINNLVLSVEGVPPKGHPFSFIESSRSQYLLAYRFLSITDAYAWMVESWGIRLNSFA